MNIVAIIGNVASDPELRHTEQGRAVCSFRVAVARTGDAQQADFFDVIAWERQAEICSTYLNVGRRVAVQGRLHGRVHEMEEGGRRTSCELIACRIELLGAGARQAQAAQEVEAVR